MQLFTPHAAVEKDDDLVSDVALFHRKGLLHELVPFCCDDENYSSGLLSVLTNDKQSGLSFLLFILGL